MVRWILKEAIKLLENKSIKVPVFGVCPRCGHSLYLVKTALGDYIVCSNPKCSYFSKIKSQAPN